MKKISLKDIAKMAGVSTSTVSFVLNGKAEQMRISKPIVEKVHQIVKKSGYQPNRVAVSLRTGKSKIIGLLVDDISNQFFASCAKFIEDEANEYGYKVIFCCTENDAHRARTLLNILNYQQVDGFIITPTVKMNKDIEQLVQYKKPFVLMDRYFPEINTPYVLVNNYSGIEKGMAHLIRKGYKRIGFVTVDLKMIQMDMREQAYKDAQKKEQPASKQKLLLKLPINCTDDREATMQTIISFIRDTELDAVFFATNYLGILGLESIQQIGLEIPRDITVICFDDNDIFRLHTPAITVIRQPIDKIAKSSVAILMDQLGAGKHKVQRIQVEIDPEFVVRKST